jgi:methionyl-tRNA synthetase
MDMRVGTIIEASKMPKANKLLILKVDTGIDVRTVSGIAEFKPEDIVGKKVTVLVNLAPRNLGVESQGMILMTTNAGGNSFVNPDTEAANGETIN